MNNPQDHSICPLCQTENRANAKFCRRCGQPRLSLEINIEKEAPQKLEPVQTNFQAKNKSTVCNHCQVQIRGTDNFCCWCGSENENVNAVDSLICPSCSSRLPAQANFCFGCGVHVGPHKRLRLRPPGEIFQAEEEEFFPTFDA